MAVTRHMRFELSTTADWMVVFGSETFVRLSHEQAGAKPGKSALGGGSAAHAPMSTLKSEVAIRVTITPKSKRPHWRFMRVIVKGTRTL